MELYKEDDKNYLDFPLVLNIELTEVCPLKCANCYKESGMSHELPKNVLIKLLEEFSRNRGKLILFSGGEPFLYPYLKEAIKLCNKKGLKTGISTSGYGVNSEKIIELFASGLNCLYISLNSHIPEINGMSRDGYQFAVEAMKICQKLNVPYRINTVIRHDNYKYLKELISFADSYGASGIDLLSNKPNSKGIIESPMELKDIEKLIQLVNEDRGFLNYQKCFTPLTSYFNKSDSKKRTIFEGCPAGAYTVAVFSNGSYAPCPHCKEREEFDSLLDYWKHSEVLKKYRWSYVKI